MTIRVRRAYDRPQPGTAAGLVDRLWPRGLARENARIEHWLRELAPSHELRRWFAHDPARWDEFAFRYADELRARHRRGTSPSCARFARRTPRPHPAPSRATTRTITPRPAPVAGARWSLLTRQPPGAPDPRSHPVSRAHDRNPGCVILCIVQCTTRSCGLPHGRHRVPRAVRPDPEGVSMFRLPWSTTKTLPPPSPSRCRAVARMAPTPGALDRLLEAGVPIEGISGTSAGGDECRGARRGLDHGRGGWRARRARPLLDGRRRQRSLPPELLHSPQPSG